MASEALPRVSLTLRAAGAGSVTATASFRVRRSRLAERFALATLSVARTAFADGVPVGGAGAAVGVGVDVGSGGGGGGVPKRERGVDVKSPG